jgi:hypothetical protein
MLLSSATPMSFTPLRSHGREGTGCQGALPRGLPRLWAPTAARGGKGDAYECKRCHPGAIERNWTRERVREATRAWDARYGNPPTSYDWSVSHASRRGPEALSRLQDAEWPAARTVSEVYGSWAAARADAFSDA